MRFPSITRETRGGCADGVGGGSGAIELRAFPIESSMPAQNVAQSSVRLATSYFCSREHFAQPQEQAAEMAPRAGIPIGIAAEPGCRTAAARTEPLQRQPAP